MKTSVPGPFKTVEDAEGEVRAFIASMHDTLDDSLTEFAEQFVVRTHPELNDVIAAAMDNVNSPATTTAIEEMPEYELFYAETSWVIQTIIQKFAMEWQGNIYGRIQHRIRERERAMVGAP